MSNSDHTTRTLLVSKKQPDTLLVSRGSNSNEDDDARDITSGHSQIRSYNITQVGPGDSPFDFLDGHLIGWGLRNSVGVAGAFFFWRYLVSGKTMSTSFNAMTGIFTKTTLAKSSTTTAC